MDQNGPKPFCVHPLKDRGSYGDWPVASALQPYETGNERACVRGEPGSANVHARAWKTNWVVMHRGFLEKPNMTENRDFLEMCACIRASMYLWHFSSVSVLGGKATCSFFFLSIFFSLLEPVWFLSVTLSARALLPRAREGLWFVARMGGCIFLPEVEAKF